MSQTRKRWTLFGASLGTIGTLAIVVGFGVLAGAGAASSAKAPVNTAPPTITGTPQQGKTLVGHRGEWTGNPTDYNDFWVRCDETGGSCSEISGANNRAGYLLKLVDVGTTIRLKVQAKNADGSVFATSVPTAVIAAATAPPPPPPVVATGCPAGSGPVNVNDVKAPARLLIDQQLANPSVVNRGTKQLVVRYRVSACGGRPVQGAMIYATVIPFNQFNVPAEQATDQNGFAQADFQVRSAFPLSSKQGLLAVFVRARKPGEDLLGGISTRRLFSIHVSQ